MGDKELQIMEESEGLRREQASLRTREEETSKEAEAGDAQLAATRLVDSLQVG